jgi:chorismate-pyruvate lyase
VSACECGAARRACFLDSASGDDDRRLLDLLLAQDGSTTRVCETIARGPVALLVRHQVRTAEVPPLVRAWLPSAGYLERITSLAAHGEVMMDNLAYIALDGLDASLRRELEAGRSPIGHLLPRLWLRREPLAGAEPLHERLWRAVGLPDPAATRAYRIVTPDGPCMAIVETFRRGMRMKVSRAPRPSPASSPARGR